MSTAAKLNRHLDASGCNGICHRLKAAQRLDSRLMASGEKWLLSANALSMFLYIGGAGRITRAWMQKTA